MRWTDVGSVLAIGWSWALGGLFRCGRLVSAGKALRTPIARQSGSAWTGRAQRAPTDSAETEQGLDEVLDQVDEGGAEQTDADDEQQDPGDADSEPGQHQETVAGDETDGG